MQIIHHPGRRKITPEQRRLRREAGKRLKEWRDQHGPSLRAAATIAGLSHSTLSRIESGKCPVRREYLDGLAEAYGLSHEELCIVLYKQPPLPHMLDKQHAERSGSDKVIAFGQRMTVEERTQLVLYLDYLRFRKRGVPST